MKYAKHKRTGNIYTIISEDGKTKMGGLWIRCIIYKNSNDEYFARGIVSFLEKFTIEKEERPCHNCQGGGCPVCNGYGTINTNE